MAVTPLFSVEMNYFVTQGHAGGSFLGSNSVSAGDLPWWNAEGETDQRSERGHCQHTSIVHSAEIMFFDGSFERNSNGFKDFAVDGLVSPLQNSLSSV